MNLRKARFNELSDICQQASLKFQNEINRLNSEIAYKKNQIITFDDTILVQEFGLYSPRYDVVNSEQ